VATPVAGSSRVPSPHASGRTRDPIRRALPGIPDTDPPKKELLKATARQSGAAPVAGPKTFGDALRRGPAGFLRLLGPGVVTGASDDDPSGIGTYSQVGSQFGYGLLWTVLLTLPLMIAVQEMCARIGLHTRMGLGASLRQRFPTPIVGAAVIALVIANTINVGADLGAIASGAGLLVGGIPNVVYVVCAAMLVLGFQLFSSYERLSSIFKWLTLALFAYVITLFFAHPDGPRLLMGAMIPRVELNSAWLAAVVAILGTTISPYLFFWQASSEVDVLRAKGRLRTRMKDEELVSTRVDVTTGMVFSQAVMFCVIASSAAVLNSHGITQVQTANQAASALQPFAGHFASMLFAAGIIGAGLLAVPVLSGSAAYAVREVGDFGGGYGIRARFRPTFYGVIVAATAIGVALNAIGFDPIKALFLTAVINGLVAPPLLVLINVVAGDSRIMGQHASGRLSRWLGWTAAGVMAVAAAALIITVIPW